RHKDPGFEKEIFAFLDKFFALCEENGIQPTEAAMSFLKRRENVQCILVGARSVDQLDRNIAAYEKDVPAGLMDQIETESDALKEIMGENADMWIGDGGRFY
ncbi:MAG: aldo/keto reductase, partial [Lachnospiraceae bacterium]|nr:aldo/keto reductase [Lachnospiraceae bacterium]